MKNKLEKAPVKFREDLLYFQHFMLIFLSLPQISDYHHLKHASIALQYCYCYNAVTFILKQRGQYNNLSPRISSAQLVFQS